MRKLFAGITAAAVCVSCLSIGVSAAGLSFNGTIDENGTVSVSGVGNPGLVSVEIGAGESYETSGAAGVRTPVLVDVGTTEATGAFAFSWELPDGEKFRPGESAMKYYTAIISNTDQKTPESERKLLLCYVSSTKLAAALAAVNGAAESGLAAVLEAVLEANRNELQIGGLLMDPTYEAQKAMVMDGVLSQRGDGFADWKAVYAAVEQALGYAAIKNATADTLNAAVLNYGASLGLSLDNYNASADLRAAMSRVAADVIRAYGLDKAEDTAKAFRALEAVAAVNIAPRGKIIETLTTYQDVFNRDTTAASGKEQTVAGGVVVTDQSKEYHSVKAVQDAYDAALNGGSGSNPGVNPGGNPGGMSGGGGIGGGGISSGGTSAGTVKVEDQKPSVIEIPSRFTDLEDTAWAKQYINALASAGIVNGKAEGIFAPNDIVTREEFTKMLAVALKLEATETASSFSDVDAGAWYAPYINQVAAAGLITGYEDGTFGVATPIIREEAAVLIARAAAYRKLELSEKELAFADNEAISEFAVDAVRLCVGAKIVQGNEENRFLPRNFITRAECAKMIYCLVELF